MIESFAKRKEVTDEESIRDGHRQYRCASTRPPFDKSADFSADGFNLTK